MGDAKEKTDCKGDDQEIQQAASEDTMDAYLTQVSSVQQKWHQLQDQHAHTFSNTLELGVQPDENITDTLFRDTAKLVMNVLWFSTCSDVKEMLLQEIRTYVSSVGEEGSNNSNLKVLMDILVEPWSKPVLMKILAGQDVPAQEVLSLVENEGTELLEIRIEVLVASNCKCEALNLLRKLSQDCHHLLSISLVDYYLSMLSCKLKTNGHHANKKVKTDIKTVFSSMQIDTIQNLIIRHSSLTCPRTQDKSVAELASSFLFGVLTRKDETQTDIMRSITSSWIHLHGEVWEQHLTNFIGQSYVLPQHVYTICDVIYELFGQTKAELCVQILILVLTQDQNTVTQLIANNQNVNSINQRRSNGFILLSKIFENNFKIYREIVLSAFSIHPTPYLLSLVRNAADLETQDINQNTAILDYHSTGCPAVCLTDDDLFSAGIDISLCDDVYTLICCARWYRFSWYLNWVDLSTLCLKYLENPAEMRADPELNNLDIDFSQFEARDVEPRGPYYGIEAGYECQLEVESNKVTTTKRSLNKKLKKKYRWSTSKTKAFRMNYRRMLKARLQNGSKTARVVCSLCLKSYKNRESMVSHKYRMHRSTQVVAKFGNKGNKTQFIESKTKNFPCKACLRRYSTADSLRAHAYKCTSFGLPKFDAKPSTSTASLKSRKYGRPSPGLPKIDTQPSTSTASLKSRKYGRPSPGLPKIDTQPSTSTASLKSQKYGRPSPGLPKINTQPSTSTASLKSRKYGRPSPGLPKIDTQPSTSTASLKSQKYGRPSPGLPKIDTQPSTSTASLKSQKYGRPSPGLLKIDTQPSTSTASLKSQKYGRPSPGLLKIDTQPSTSTATLKSHKYTRPGVPKLSDKRNTSKTSGRIQNSNLDLSKLNTVKPSTSCDTTEENLTCSVCNKWYRTSANLWEHMKQHNAEPNSDKAVAVPSNQNKPSLITCEFCGKDFKTQDTLKIHINKFHIGIKDLTQAAKLRNFNKSGKPTAARQLQISLQRLVRCNFCGNNFVSHAALRTHIMKHHGDQEPKLQPEPSTSQPVVKEADLHSYFCRYCNKQYKYRARLHQHEHIFHGKHSSARTKPRNQGEWCKFCKDRFPSLDNHILLQHKCKYCLKTVSDLKYHCDYHHYQVEVPAECICPHCGLSFKRHATLQHHLTACLESVH